MSVINTNIKALYTQAALKGTNREMTVAMQQLATGKRVNSAKDDAAGLAISTRMTQQIRSLDQAIRNAGDAISLIQTTEGATQAITDMLQRMRELSIQAINDTNSNDQRSYLDLEFQQLKQEIARIADTVEWNGFPVLNGTAGEAVGERPVYKVTSEAAFASTTASGSLSALASGDLVINGITIGASYASDDTRSHPANAEASAIAKATAINRYSEQTGVHAVVNETVMHGTAQTGTTVVSGRVRINGIESATITTVANNTRDSRQAVIKAINQISEKTGVVAIDTDSDFEGVKLVAKDGRNIQMDFLPANNATDNEFAARTGLREGTQSGTYSLESMVTAPVVIGTTSDGTVSHSGLQLGDFSQNVSRLSTASRAAVALGQSPVSLKSGDLVINGYAIRATVDADDTLTDLAALAISSQKRSASGAALAAAINASSADTGVTAIANPVQVVGAAPDIRSSADIFDGDHSFHVNGMQVTVNILETDDATSRAQKVVDAINPLFGATGVTASVNERGGVSLSTEGGRSLSIWIDPNDGLVPADIGLPAAQVSTTALQEEASTLYAGVTLVSSKAFTVEPGANGYGADSNFAQLGFREGTFGGEVDAATSKLSPPRVGRMSFHVGASAHQTITIDLSDFGKHGPITGSITGDVDAVTPTVRINTSEAAKAVLDKLDTAMDKVNATRANMGAVMNRLEQVIDNLTNVSMNSSASRSQIEDADYAQASTDLAKAQIMQQAATAVLAQANTSQQTILKLLQ